MPPLSTEQMVNIIDRAVTATMHKDWDGIHNATEPLWEPPDVASNLYMFVMGMIGIVVDVIPRPCPEHGPGCNPGLKFATTDDEGRLAPVSAEIVAKLTPASAAYLRMLIAQYNDDAAASVAAFHDAAQANVVVNLMWAAMQNAANVVRSTITSQQ